jgi:hypothetical protein
MLAQGQLVEPLGVRSSFLVSGALTFLSLPFMPLVFRGRKEEDSAFEFSNDDEQKGKSSSSDASQDMSEKDESQQDESQKDESEKESRSTSASSSTSSSTSNSTSSARSSVIDVEVHDS